MKKNGREQFEKNKKIIKFIIQLLYIFPRSIRIKLYKRYKMQDNRKALLLRYCLVYTLVNKCGDNVFIGPNVEIKYFKNLSIGFNTSIHENTYIDAEGKITIENNVSIAHGTSIISANHTYLDEDKPIKYNKMEEKPITICSDVWIGAKATILPGVIVETRSIVAAGAVVTKCVKSKTIVAGIPASAIREI